MFSLIFKPIGEFADRAICLIFAVLFAQTPLYIEQYQHVLSGALAEARINYEDIEKRANELNMSVEKFISYQFEASSMFAERGDTLRSRVFDETGKHLQEGVMRYEQYQISFEQLSTAALWERPFIFLQNKDENLLAALDFKPGLPFSEEGLAYVIAGLLVGLFFMLGIRAVGKKLFSKKNIVPINTNTNKLE